MSPLPHIHIQRKLARQAPPLQAADSVAARAVVAQEREGARGKQRERDSCSLGRQALAALAGGCSGAGVLWECGQQHFAVAEIGAPAGVAGEGGGVFVSLLA